MTNRLKSELQQAKSNAIKGCFHKMETICRKIIQTHENNIDVLLDVGTLLQNFGYISLSRDCLEKILAMSPKNIGALTNLANLSRDAAKHDQALQIYSAIMVTHPNQPVIRRNFLVSQEYDPSISDSDRFHAAMAWGDWVISQVGGKKHRPLMSPLINRTLRIGYVSADFCQHTVGLFITPVLQAQNTGKVTIFAYYAGKVSDWVTDTIKSICTLRDISSMNDAAAANLIRHDKIDVLVDLSGHTAGSRLTVFARRPAPVQISWLGYFATTGLSYMDAVFLDDWHAPPGMEKKFVEQIIRLPLGRFCYDPVPFAPETTALPCLKNGFITFGSFNNTAKLNSTVFNLWAKILNAIPNSRLILKWRIFNDENFRRETIDAFVQRKIASDRIELRGPSFHVDLLKEYSDIDICLDTFPFTGGLTSCEALWMGVPVVTWPQTRVVSRQTYAILSAIGLPKLAARDAEDYIRIATDLANDQQRLKKMRHSLRCRMKASPLCDVSAYTKSLEDTMINLYNDIEQRQNSEKIFLNVGAGHPKSGAAIPEIFRTSGWKEVRLDVDPANEPDIIGSMIDMAAVESESVHAVFSSHTIEHLYPDEVGLSLKEMLRVLTPEGYAVITCPDLQAAAQMIAQDKLLETAYQSPAGPITPFDIVYSCRQFTGRDKPFMAHHCGFTLKVLIGTLKENGFQTAAGIRRTAAFDLWVIATKTPMDEQDLRLLAQRVLPMAKAGNQ